MGKEVENGGFTLPPELHQRAKAYAKAHFGGCFSFLIADALEHFMETNPDMFSFHQWGGKFRMREAQTLRTAEEKHDDPLDEGGWSTRKEARAAVQEWNEAN